MSNGTNTAVEVASESGEPTMRQRWEALERGMRARLGPVGVSTLDEIRKRSGLDFLLAIGHGELPSPPIFHTLRFWPVEVEPGRMVFQGTPGAEHYNLVGRQAATAEGRLIDSAGKLYPFATTTCLVSTL